MKNRSIRIAVALVVLAGCRRFVEIPPPQNQLVSSNVFTNDQSATAAVVGLYSQMMNDLGGFALNNGGIGICTGLTGDEFVNYSSLSDQAQLFQNSIQPNNSFMPSLWNNGYNYIYTCNAIIEGLAASHGVSESLSQQLLGEALFIRAFCNFNLTNLFGEIPIVTITDYKTNLTLAKSSRDSVYHLILSDLQKAIGLLPSDFTSNNGEHTRVTRAAAMAMLSRVCLYLGQWDQAKSDADSVLQQTDQFSLTDINSVFLANSPEAILQFLPGVPGYNTWDGANFILTDDPAASLGQVALSRGLIAAFEPTDLRRTTWVDSISVGDSVYYYPFKYKIQQADVVSEYFMVLRVGELILIRAEAEAQLNSLPAALIDLNTIRARAGLSSFYTASQSDLLEAIQRERRVELFCEWGHRWFDLKRTGEIQSRLSSTKSSWQAKDSLYPIPLGELQTDHNLVQNPGY